MPTVERRAEGRPDDRARSGRRMTMERARPTGEVGDVRHDEVVLAWTIVEDADRPPAAAPDVDAGAGPPADDLAAMAGVDHCPACSGREIEVSLTGLVPQMLCLGCARRWIVGIEGLSFLDRVGPA